AGRSVGVGPQWVRFGSREVHAWDCLEPGEPGLKCLSDLVSIRRHQAVCLGTGMKRPGVENVLRPEPGPPNQQFIPQDCRGIRGEESGPGSVCALARPVEPAYGRRRL